MEEMKPQFSSHSGPSVKREVHPGLWGGATTHHKFGSVKAELCFALNLTLDLHFHHMEWHLKVYTSGGGVLSNGPGMPLELSSHPEAEFSKEIIIIIPL